MENIIASLKSSPLFNLSLSSKELFHSNFIAWLIEIYPEEIWKIFSKYITDINPSQFKIKEKSVEREKNHIDIMFDVINIENKKEIKVIIENKVKSLPYRKQLEEYTALYPNAYCILLSLSTPKHLLESDKIVKVKVKDFEKDWHLLTYEQLIQDITSIDFKNNEDGLVINNNLIYHKQIIVDYVTFVNRLVEIDKLTAIHENENIDWYNNEIFKALNEIRLGDFYIKKKCENLICLIEENIKNNKEGKIEAMFFNSSIVNSTNGEFRFYYKLTNRISISIEVSKMYYRKMVHFINQKEVDKEIIKYSPLYEAEKVAAFFNTLFWFNFEHIKKQEGSYNQRNPYNKFGDSRYCQCQLSEANTVEEIISYFVHDFNEILNCTDKINQEFK